MPQDLQSPAEAGYLLESTMKQPEHIIHSFYTSKSMFKYRVLNNLIEIFERKSIEDDKSNKKDDLFSLFFKNI